jgi:hypothetical protein
MQMIIGALVLIGVPLFIWQQFSASGGCAYVWDRPELIEVISL